MVEVVLGSEQGNQLENWSDLELYQMCQKYGAAVLEARRKFLGLLPEVSRRDLWRSKGFCSIFHFAAKLAGVSEEQVRLTLNLGRRFGDKPLLHKALTKGEISINKLAKVASIVTLENQAEILRLSANFSTRALETYVRDWKIEKAGLTADPMLVAGRDVLSVKPEVVANRGVTAVALAQESLHVNSKIPLFLGKASEQVLERAGKNEAVQVELEARTLQRLKDLQNKGIDIDEIINQALDQREAQIAAEKEKLGEEQERKAELRAEYEQRVIGPVSKAGRYIPVKIKRVLTKEHGGKCSVATCQRVSATIHHTLRFAMGGNHDPRFLTPLCREHHEIAHKIDLDYLEKSRVGG